MAQLYCIHAAPGVILVPRLPLCAYAGVALCIATACNLASPVVTGILFEILTGGRAASAYPKFLGVLATLYIVEPLVTRVYIQNACAAGEKVKSPCILCVMCKCAHATYNFKYTRCLDGDNLLSC